MNGVWGVPLLLLVAILGLTGCGATQSRYGDAQTRSFNINSLAKSDINMVTDLHVERVTTHLRELAEKLYRRNPAELRKSGLTSLQEGLTVIFDQSRTLARKRTRDRVGSEAIRLAFRPNYTDDRVFAFMFGLHTMIVDAYEGQSQFFVLDKLNPQTLYNSARNLELASWMLTQTHTEAGKPYLLSYSADNGRPNLSFERLFGKMIALQDAIAETIAQSSNRTIKSVIQSVATGLFLPI